MKRLFPVLALFLFTSVTFAQTSHNVLLNWVAPTNPIGGEYVNIYRGTTTGGESATPINTAGIKISTLTFTDINVVANTTYFYVAKGCAINLVTNSEVCSAPSNEVSVTVPLASGDLSSPTSLGAVGK